LRLAISLSAERSLRLPMNYNQLVQAAIYRHISPSLASLLHDRGYTFGKRSFKLFTFSRLLGKYQLDRERKEIVFPRGARLVVSSPVHEFCSELVSGLLSSGRLELGRQEVEITGVEVTSPKVPKNRAVLELLSPVVVYSTFEKPGGGKYTCYFQPGEEEFSRLLQENLTKKYAALYREPAPLSRPLEVKVLNRPHMNLVRYKGIVIKGYTCRLELQGPPQLLHLGLEAGLGGKNSQGFGCAEISPD